ncbi:MAG TPA: hypothetical protein VJO16_00850 [Candidatus Acidoferrum sp.]|nr:hypothetical protein [Candidatus Acidoferrum sp.]
MRMRFFQGTALLVSLAAALVTGVFPRPRTAEASERAGPFGCAQDKQAPPLQKPGSGGEERKVAGTWRGESLCVEKGTACHDEVAVYRIAAIPDKPGYLMVSGGKVVDGKEIVMGTGEWRYDSAKRTMSVELPRGVITLKADGDRLEGTFILPDKTVLRRISLKRSTSGE